MTETIDQEKAERLKYADEFERLAREAERLKYADEFERLARELGRDNPKSRILSLVITKLEEAGLWYAKLLREEE